jgi:hypothetical protein
MIRLLPIAAAVSLRTHGWEQRRAALAVSLVLLAAGLVSVVESSPSSAAGSSCGASINPIVCENQQPGTPDSVWDISGSGDPTIQGFATDISVNAGNAINFKISTPASAYTIDIYRLGYYGGNGARRVTSVTPSAHLPQTQPACASDPSTSLYDCGTWAVSASWAVPSSAVSGVYLADLKRTDTGGMSQITFVVRNDSSTSDVVYQTSDETWQAYNRYGGSDFYTGDQQNLFDSPSRARALSYNRPFITRGDNNGRDFLFSNEYPTIRFLEQNGYDVTYIAGVDTDRYGASLLQRHKVFMSVGHDEYWSQPQLTNVKNARDAGVNLMFLSGNEVFWHTRFAASIDGSNTAYRTLICYKETWDNAATDPSGESTGTWRDPRFSAAPGGSSPENGLTGTLYMANSDDLPLTVTAAEGKTRLWRNTGLNSMSGGSTDLAQHIVGYESDEDVDNGFRPAGLIDLSTTVGSTPQESIDFGQKTAPGTTTHHLTEYRAPSGALVFSAGTIQWAWGLDSEHDGAATTGNTQMQQSMINLFADMHVQPQTRMSTLVAATASSDTTAPTSTITSPSSGTAIANGTVLTVTGTASDTGGVVAGVEVSIDSGATWHPATGTTSWTYTGTIHGNGPVTIRSRATDDSLNAETPSSGVAVTTSCPCTLMGNATPSTPDSGDPIRAALGVRFTPSTAGYVTGVRFYKSAANTGAHTGSLWTASGTLLATGSFSNETSSGWQTLLFSSPVVLSANTTYVASYFAPNGHYSDDGLFFYYRDYQATPLVAQSNSPTDSSKYNGVFATSDTFPSQKYAGDNYYVDPIFIASQDGSPAVTSTNPADKATNVATATTPSATFSTAVTPSSINFTVASLGGSVGGTVSYDAASKTATFTPTSGLATGTKYTASIKATGTNGLAMVVPTTWQFTTAGPVTCPCTLFDPDSAPATPDSGDRSALTLGMKFSSSVAGSVSGVRFYKAGTNTGTHTGSLWAASGVLLATGTFTNETGSGWQTLQFTSPVSIAANTTYVVSYYAPSGHYSEDDNYFASSVTNGPLTAPAGAGVYRYGSDAFPTQTYANANYWVDPIFTTSSGSPPPTPPSVTSTTPNAGDTSVATSVHPSATFSSPVTTASVSFTVSSILGAISGTVAYNSGTQTATFTPSAALATGTQYTATVTATGTNGLPMSAPDTWSFTTSGPASCPCTLFGSATPTTVDAGDRASVSLGVTFSSSTSGYVSGVRFYKAGTNTGTHTGSLWSAGGTLLATATFTGETASGWQFVNFSSPVPVTAGTTYVASYFAPVGRYSEDDHYFDSSFTNGPLTAPASAGVYAYGGDGFPSSSYANANYWVDPIFVTDAGSGGGGSPPPTPPTVTSSTPTAGATGVASSVKPTAVFSAPVDPSTITFTLTGPAGAVSGTSTYDSASQTATFTPAAPLAGSTAFNVSVSATGTNGAAMTSAQTWSFTTAAPPDTTPPTISSVSATGSGTSATITWTTNEASTSRVDYGTSPSALTSNATAPGMVLSHSIGLSGLASGTTYYYRVTSADAAGNSATSPGTPATYTTPIVPPSSITDTATTDFSSGTTSSTYVATNGDGEVVLTPSIAAEFTGTTLPSGIVSNNRTGGSSKVANGTVTVLNADLTTSTTYANPRSFEVSATLGKNNTIGWVTSSNGTVGMAFTVNSSNQLVATSNDGFTGNNTSVLASNWTPAQHKFRVEWTSSAATFYLDDVQRYTHSFVSVYSNLRPQMSDAVTTDGGLVVDWLRVGPYAASGTFTSRVFDAKTSVRWGALTWDATVPSATTLTVRIRSGNTAIPDGTWSAFATISTPGGAINKTSRYVQYQLSFTSSGSRFVSPAVRSVTAAVLGV